MAAVLLLAAGSVAIYLYVHRSGGTHRSTSRPTAGAGHGYLVPGSTRYADVCLDKSGSVDKDAHLAGRATDLLEQRIPALNPSPVKPYTTEPTAPENGLNLTVRVVRKNSYSTATDTEYIVPADIPATPGLRKARPNDDPAAGANWDLDEATVEKAQGKAAAAQDTVARTLSRLTSLTSDGSDVLGCVAADLAARGTQTSVSLWIISDLETKQPKASKGKPLPAYRGAFGNAKVVISQACPDGNQAACAQRYETFKNLLADLGIEPDRVVVRPSDSLEQAYALWLRPTAPTRGGTS